MFSVTYWVTGAAALGSSAETMGKRSVKSFSSVLHSLSLGIVLFAFLSVGAEETKSPLAPAMFIFGDSLIDDGNNNFIPSLARANYQPYGIDFGFPSGRFCNGLTVVDYGAQLLGLPFTPPYLSPTSKGAKILRGINYASAAAGILDETGKHYGGRVSFNGQLALFEKTLALDLGLLFQTREALLQYLAKSIFVINVGSNDYINNYLLPKIYASPHVYSREAFADLLISIYSLQLSKLYELGARKIVLVGIGALGCIPSQLAMVNGNDSCVERVNYIVSAFNERLQQLVPSLNSTLPGSYFVFHDVYSVFSDIVHNPSKYGFTVANKACCGNGRFGGTVSCLPNQVPCLNREEYVFWDSFHPTQAVNAIIAQSCYTPEATNCHPVSVYELAKI
ncbi:GDSL esterase/lipase 7 [Aristolochia californica]|uniref:GDSL esterase/lipase 7 n=1 Tax=Aristolochia californica TaxID=171875 RepID=UPI0035DB530D